MKYYRKEYPELNDIVYGHVSRITKTHIWVELTDYNDIPGMIIIADATIRKKRKSYCLMKINKNYPLVIKSITNGGKDINLSHRYVTKEESKYFLKNHDNYKKVLRIFRSFLNSQKKEFTDEYFNEMADKTIWNVKKEELLDYITEYYLGNNNLENFDLSEEEKSNFKESIQKSFGKLKINTKYKFTLKNPGFNGVDDIISIFDKIKEKYDTDVLINTAPQYYLDITSESETNNTDLINKIEQDIESMSKENKCLYKLTELTTTNNL
jgi:translation initiation factor 2 subunit 1